MEYCRYIHRGSTVRQDGLRLVPQWLRQGPLVVVFMKLHPTLLESLLKIHGRIKLAGPSDATMPQMMAYLGILNKEETMAWCCPR